MRKGLITVLERELHRMTSKPIYVMMTVVIPCIVIIFFATFFNQGSPTELPVAVVDFDNSQTSRMIVRTLSSGQMCDVKYRLTSYESAKSKMQTGDIYAFVVIPRDFEKELYSQRSPVINVNMEYAHYMASGLIMKEINTTLNTISAGADLKVRLQKGQDRTYAMSQINPIATDMHIIGNPQLNYAMYLSSVMMPGIIFLMALICTVYVIGIELKNASAPRWLILGRRNIGTAIFGKLIPYTLLFSIMAILSEIVMEKYMGFQYYGNPLWLYLGSLLTVIASQAMGVLIIGLLPSMRTAMSIAAFYGVFSFTLSGFTYPQSAMLPAVQPYSYIYPLYHYYNIFCDVELNGLGFRDICDHFIWLLAFNFLPFITLFRLKKACVYLNYERD